MKKYSFQEKKKICDKIDKLKKIGNKNHFIVIGKLIKKSLTINGITEKKNGIWFDLNNVDDITLKQINIYITNILNQNIILDKHKNNKTIINYTPYKINNNYFTDHVGPKFSKKEKTLIHKFKTNSITYSPILSESSIDNNIITNFDKQNNLIK